MNKNVLRKLLLVALITALFALVLTACRGDGGTEGGLAADVEGEITIMTWSGDGSVIRDAGRSTLTPEEISNVYVASLIATARAFNEIYPNVVINFYASAGGSGYWDQRREDFALVNGRFPDIFKSVNLVADAQRGLIADLSVFADDPRMQRINPTVREKFTRHGFIFGFPLESIPWGVYVNRELAEQNNIPIPRPDWNIDEYTAFVTNTDHRTFWGAHDAPHEFLDMMTHYTHYTMIRPGPGGVPHVNLEADAIRHILSYVPQWSTATIRDLDRMGQLPAGVRDQFHWWRIMFFSGNGILSTHTNPWELGNVASVAPGVALAAVSNDWDYFPFPSTPYRGNTIRMLYTPWAIYNYAEGEHEMTPEQRAQLDLSFAFMMFYMTDNRAWEARANQRQVVGTDENYNPIIGTRIFTNFPIVTGADFDFQMQTMFSTDSFSQLADADRFPGFHKVLDIMQNGDTVGAHGIAFPRYVEVGGYMVGVIHEWELAAHYNLAIYFAGVHIHEPQWLDNVLARLPEWNRLSNERLALADQQLRESLTRWYGITFD